MMILGLLGGLTPARTSLALRSPGETWLREEVVKVDQAPSI